MELQYAYPIGKISKYRLPYDAISGLFALGGEMWLEVC